MREDDLESDVENPTEMEILIKDFLSWCRQPTGSMVGYPRFETAKEWQEWFDRGAFIREKASDLFEELATARTGGDPDDEEQV